MKNEQKWLLKEMYSEGYRDIKIIGVYAYFVNPTFLKIAAVLKCGNIRHVFRARCWG